jgi:hypothetical protein
MVDYNHYHIVRLGVEIHPGDAIELLPRDGRAIKLEIVKITDCFNNTVGMNFCHDCHTGVVILARDGATFCLAEHVRGVTLIPNKYAKKKHYFAHLDIEVSDGDTIELDVVGRDAPAVLKEISLHDCVYKSQKARLCGTCQTGMLINSTNRGRWCINNQVKNIRLIDGSPQIVNKVVIV